MIGGGKEIIENKNSDREYSLKRNFQTPMEKHKLISGTDPFNSDMNEMDMTYYTGYNAKYKKFRFYVKLDLSIELPTAGTTVYMVIGFQNTRDN